jgi:hypothetical protein
VQRRRALTIAGTTTASVAGAALAIAANVGLLGFSRADTSALGELEADRPAAAVTVADPTTTSTTAPAPPVVVQYEDVIVRDPAPAAPPPAAEVASTDSEDETEVDTTTTAVTPATTDTTTTTEVLPIPSRDGDEHEADEVEHHDGEEDDD